MGVGIGRLAGTELTLGAAGAAARPRAAARRESAGRWRGGALGAGLVVGAALAAAGALAWGHAAPDTSAVPSAEMGRLLRFMALVKAVVPAGALVGLVRRVRRPVAAGRLAAYAAGLWACAAGPALIAQLGHVGLGALCFHAGWLAMAAAAWGDAGIVAARARG